MKKILYIFIVIFIFSGCSLKHESVNETQNIILKNDEKKLDVFLKNTNKILKIRNPSLALYLNSRFA